MLDKKSDKKSKRLGFLMLSLGVICLDQLLKFWVLIYLNFQIPKIIIPGFFNLYLDYNYGAAFSFLSQESMNKNSWAHWFFLLLAPLVSLILILLILFKKHLNHWELLGLSLVLGGALGNFTDRLIHGYVIDFIQWYFKNFYWPSFNLADSCICLGVFFMVLGSFFKKDQAC